MTSQAAGRAAAGHRHCLGWSEGEERGMAGGGKVAGGRGGAGEAHDREDGNQEGGTDPTHPTEGAGCPWRAAHAAGRPGMLGGTRRGDRGGDGRGGCDTGGGSRSDAVGATGRGRQTQALPATPLGERQHGEQGRNAAARRGSVGGTATPTPAARGGRDGAWRSPCGGVSRRLLGTRNRSSRPQESWSSSPTWRSSSLARTFVDVSTSARNHRWCGLPRKVGCTNTQTCECGRPCPPRRSVGPAKPHVDQLPPAGVVVTRAAVPRPTTPPSVLCFR